MVDMPGTSIERVTLVGTYEDFIGDPGMGFVRFRPSTALRDILNNLMILPASFSVDLDEDGSFSIDLPVTNDTTASPLNFTYEVTEHITNAPGRTYSISLPAGSGTLNLADLAPVGPSGGDPVAPGAGAGLSAEDVRDLVATLLVAGTNVTILPNDALDTITISATGGGGGGGGTREEIEDLLGSSFVGAGLATVTYSDAGNSFTVSVTTEAVQDVVGALLIDSTSIDVTYDDAGNAETIAVKDEYVQDVVAGLLVGGTGITETYNDVGNIDTISVDTSVIATKTYVDGAVAGVTGGASGTIYTPALARWYYALANRHFAPATAICIGDSLTEGQGASALSARAVTRLQKLLRGWYPSDGRTVTDLVTAASTTVTSATAGFTATDIGLPITHPNIPPHSRIASITSGTSVVMTVASTVAGTGLTAMIGGGSGGAEQPIISPSRNVYASDSGWGASGLTKTGSTSAGSYGAFGKHALEVYSAGTVKFDFVGTRAVLKYGRQPGAATIGTWKLDGGSTTNIGAGGSDDYLGSVQVYSGASGAHSITVTGAGSGMVVLALEVFDGDESRGIRFQPWARTGYKASDYAGDTFDNAVYGAVAPSLVIIELGANEFLNDETPASYKTNLDTIISRVKAAITPTPSIVLVASYDMGGAHTGTYPWSQYVTKMQGIVDADPTNIVLCDLSKLMPDTSNTAQALYRSDKVHPTDKGHSYMADTLASFLAP